MKITIPISPAVIMSVKKKVVNELIDKFNKDYANETGNLCKVLTWQQNEGKIYVLKGTEIIAII